MFSSTLVCRKTGNHFYIYLDLVKGVSTSTVEGTNVRRSPRVSGILFQTSVKVLEVPGHVGLRTEIGTTADGKRRTSGTKSVCSEGRQSLVRAESGHKGGGPREKVPVRR